MAANTRRGLGGKKFPQRFHGVKNILASCLLGPSSLVAKMLPKPGVAPDGELRGLEHAAYAHDVSKKYHNGWWHPRHVPRRPQDAPTENNAKPTTERPA